MPKTKARSNKGTTGTLEQTLERLRGKVDYTPTPPPEPLSLEEQIDELRVKVEDIEEMLLELKHNLEERLLDLTERVEAVEEE